MSRPLSEEVFMGHAIHFLQRLERVDDRQVERALLMYRSGARVREVLRRLPLPEGAERVAVSLEHDHAGPFVIVTRGGAFITCLAAGMGVGDTPIVTRAAFERESRCVSYFDEEQRRVAQFEREHPEGEVARLWRRFDHAGLQFCREDAERVQRILPLIVVPLLEKLVDEGARVAELTRTVRALRRKKNVPRAQFAELAARYERIVLSCANRLPFLGLDSLWGPTLDSVRGAVAAVRMALARECFAWGSGLHAYRGLWLALRAGRCALPELLHEAPLDAAAHVFRALVLDGYAATPAPAVHGEPGALAAELQRAVQLSPACAWFHDPRHTAHFARLSAALPRLARAELSELFVPKAELDPRLAQLKPNLARWLHRFPGEATPRVKPLRDFPLATRHGKDRTVTAQHIETTCLFPGSRRADSKMIAFSG
jgi:hypothetical protein